MTQSGDPLENAVAERVNGILKEEYLDTEPIHSIKEANADLHKAIKLYNSKRPHMIISNYPPDTIHHATEPIKVKQLWKNYYPQEKASVNYYQD